MCAPAEGMPRESGNHSEQILGLWLRGARIPWFFAVWFVLKRGGRRKCFVHRISL